MALTKNTNTSSKFEAPDDEGTVDTGTEAQAAAPSAEGAKPVESAKPAVQPSESRQVAPAATTAVATSATIMQQDPLAALRNACPVDYNTLTQIMVSNGNVLLKEGAETMGDHVIMNLISFQDQWVMSPGGEQDDEEARKYLKYSNDGIHVKDTGELLTDVRAAAIADGYDKASINQRMIVVGALVYAGVDKKGNPIEDLIDELVQIDLAPRSRNHFEAYRINAAYKVSQNKLTPEQARVVKMSAVLQSGGKLKWTDAKFSVAS